MIIGVTPYRTERKPTSSGSTGQQIQLLNSGKDHLLN